MKAKPLIAFLLLCAMAIACNDVSSPAIVQTKSDKENPCSQVMDKANHVITPLFMARRDVDSLDSLCSRRLCMPNPVKAFTIRAIDLFSAMGMPGVYADSDVCKYKFVRVYLAYRKDSNSFKLYMVPVDSACMEGTDKTKWNMGKDVLLDKAGEPLLPGDPGEGSVLDLNAPCPTTCPEKSPLLGPVTNSRKK